MLFFFAFWILFIAFGVLNVIIGVIVESTHEASKQMELDNVAQIMKDKLGTLAQIRNSMWALDSDGNGEVSLTEINDAWDKPEFQGVISQMGLPEGWTPQEMLALLDVDADGKLTFEEFMTSFYRIIADDPFKQACCLHSGLNEVKRDGKLLHHKVDRVEAEVKAMSSTLSRLEALLQGQSDSTGGDCRLHSK